MSTITTKRQFPGYHKYEMELAAPPPLPVPGTASTSSP